MRFPRCCCFNSQPAVLDDQHGDSVSAVGQRHRHRQVSQGSSATKKSFWPFKRRRTTRDVQSKQLLGTQSNAAGEQSAVDDVKAATAAALRSGVSQEGKASNKTSITASSQHTGPSAPETEPLITPEEANARLTSAKLPPHVSTIPGANGSPPKSPEIEALPEGFELSPFSPSVRWAKDRKARKLASGATAVVYRGELTRSTGGKEVADSDTKSFTIVQVAIKAVNHDTQGNEEMAAHEGSVLSGLKGLNGVPAYFGNYQDPPTRRWHRQTYILTELLPGMNIDDLCYKVCRAHARCTDRQQVLDIRHWVFDLSIHVVHHLAKALVGIHKERSHRDLKSGNVVVSGWDGRGALRVNLVDWASSRLHTEEHRLNEYCTPEYSSPQLIAAITNLPAPVMNDTANDMWSLGVVFFQMLMNTIAGRQMPFDASDQQRMLCGREELLMEVQKTIQQQHDEWAAVDPLSVGTQDDSLQPWQLTALQESVDFSDSPTEAADRCREVTTILSGLLEIDDNKRWTAEQLASCSWLSEAASGQISPSPLQLR